MSASAAEFSGSVPGFYDRYLGPILFEPFARDLVARLPNRERLRVLELACGTGILTRRIRESLPDSATVIATDLNQAMIEYAREVVHAPDIEWRQADAQALPFADGSFDVVACQFGFMFLPDKVQGFREARRVLADGGLLLANAWLSLNANPPMRTIHETLARLWPSDPPRFLETPYGYHATDGIRADLAEAGWDEVRLETVVHRSLQASEELAAGLSRGSPLIHELLERGGDVDAVIRTLADALGADGTFEAELAATVITART